MNPFEFTYGIEIECYLPEGSTHSQVASAIARRLGTPCVAENYGHTTPAHWKVVTDGSLGDIRRGMEVVSPILSGEAGLAAVVKVMDALNDFGCTVSRSCGLHVHVGVGTPTIQFFRDLLKLYATYEPIIDGFMPPSRRESRNLYCRSVSNVQPAAIDRAATLEDLLRLISMRGNELRYHKLNYDAYRRHRTVEFRQHSGTLDASKANNWVLFCLRMVGAAKAGLLQQLGSTDPNDAPALNRARRGSKAHQIGELLLRPEGLTRTEAMAATGWAGVSLPKLIDACGIAYTTQRTGREVRYFAQAAPAAAAAAMPVRPSLDTLCDTLNCEAGEREYLRTRTANLSGPTEWQT